MCHVKAKYVYEFVSNYTYMHTCIQQTDVQACRHAPRQAGIQTYRHTNTHADGHTYMHARIQSTYSTDPWDRVQYTMHTYAPAVGVPACRDAGKTTSTQGAHALWSRCVACIGSCFVAALKRDLLPAEGFHG